MWRELQKLLRIRHRLSICTKLTPPTWLSPTGFITYSIYLGRERKKKLEWWSKSPFHHPNRMARAIRSLLVTFPLRTPSVIRGSGVGGIHQNSLCSVRYTKEPLRIRDGLLCLWLSTLGPLPSSPAPAWCELISHPSGLARRTITCMPLEQAPLCNGELYHISYHM